VLHGGSGTRDCTDYNSASGAVTVDLGTGKGSGGEAQGDTYVSIELVRGSDFDDTLIGNSDANTLDGKEGSDVLIGGGGMDTLYGDAGTDTYSGGGDADNFVFNYGTVLEYILDFSQTDGDIIDVCSFEPTGDDAIFNFIGQAGFTGEAWQLRFAQVNGDTVVSGDIDGDAVADFSIHCTGTINFVASNFLL
jgi:Ca2+-binding RTX toxin-like protein